LQSAQIDEQTRNKLTLALDIRHFAQQHFFLPVGKHYTTYVALNRPYVVWNVFAAPNNSTTPTTWCFPIAGCVAYRGYFAEQDARDYAAKLSAEGWDTYVGGIGAYSTLGWFDDPVLSSFLYDDPDQLAALLFHELAHQQLYVKNDSTFNESFATAVEFIALHHWLEQQGQQQRFANTRLRQQRHQAFVQLVLTHRAERQRRYAQMTNAQQIDLVNAELRQQLRRDYQQFKQQWNGYSGYDRWFSGPLNNAQLSTVATYQTLLPGFIGLFHQVGEDILAFYAACAELAELTQPERHVKLQAFSEALPSDSLYFSLTP
jgi:predicted aminopeptidase